MDADHPPGPSKGLWWDRGEGVPRTNRDCGDSEEPLSVGWSRMQECLRFVPFLLHLDRGVAGGTRWGLAASPNAAPTPQKGLCCLSHSSSGGGRTLMPLALRSSA